MRLTPRSRLGCIRTVSGAGALIRVVGGITHMATTRVQRRAERIASWILHGLAWLFAISCLGFFLLGVSGLAKRWHLDLQQIGTFVSRFVMVPLLVCWGAMNGTLILWRQAVALRSHKGQTDRRAVTLFVAFSIFAVCLIVGAVYLMVRFFQS